jgi:hypothetical protein
MKPRNARLANPAVAVASVAVVVAAVAVAGVVVAAHAAGKRYRVAVLPGGTHHISLSCATTSTVAVSPAFRFSTPMLVRTEIFSIVSKSLSVMKRLFAP